MPRAAMSEKLKLGVLLPTRGLLLDDGSGWDVRVQDNAWDFTYHSGEGENDRWSFVYLPYDTPGLIGGHYDGMGGVDLRSVGEFSMSRMGAGEYVLTILGETPETGMLLLTVSDRPTYAGIVAPGDNVLSYEGDGAGHFVIHSRDLPSLKLQDTRFVWAFMGFSPRPARQ